MKNSIKILLYHGVTNVKSLGIENFSFKHIHSDIFYNQMKFLKKNFKIISMDELVYLNINKISFPKKTVVISFDDGFLNNKTIAAPILNSLSIPCTFYISTSFIDSKKMFWVDEIEDCINLTKKKYLNIDKLSSQLAVDNNKNKIKTINYIKKILKNSPNNFKNDIIKNLINETKVNPSVNHSANYKKITTKSLITLNNNKLFTIGGHSHNHSILSSLKLDDAKKEIDISLKILKKILKRNIIHYSYPEGQKNHFNLSIIKYMKSKGIICCPTAVEGKNYSHTDLFNLKRIMIGFEGAKFPFK